MEESTDSDFTITYEEVTRSFDQVSEEEGVGIGADMSGDSASPERDNAENEDRRRNQQEQLRGGKAKRLSPRQRHRRHHSPGTRRSSGGRSG